ncbi:hypothetical protein [Actinocorallia longicatena]|uniref:Uncharacterized protein n=1 Tax=Actinocorallia longicatena TaxID=111803 RepID=A0ABP6QBR2_9ACTN
MDDGEREDLAARYPGWRFWRTRHGVELKGLMATRRRDLSEKEIAAGLAQSLPYGLTESLDSQLARQDRLEKDLGL